MKGFIVACVILVPAIAAYASGAKEEDSFSAPGIESVEISAEHLNVEVRASDGDAASMRSDLPQESFFNQRGFQIKHEVTGSNLRVWIELAGGNAARRPGTLFFRVPKATILDVESASGNVWVNGLSAAELHAKSVSGNLQVGDVQAAVTAESVSGDIVVRRIRGRTDLKTTSGSIGMTDLAGEISARTVSGPIDGDHVELTGDSLFKSESGSVWVGLSNDLATLHYELSTDSGSLTVGSVRASGVLQAGTGTPTLKGETGSGSQTYR